MCVMFWGLVSLRGSIAWRDVGGWTLSKRTSGLDLDEDDCDHCKNCVLTIIMINMAIMMYKIIVKRGSKSKFAKA